MGIMSQVEVSRQFPQVQPVVWAGGYVLLFRAYLLGKWI
jgi:hypothetical protein